MALKKELSLFTAVLYGVGIILGAGIYVLIGEAAGIAGNSFWISFAIAAVIAAFTGLSYAELSGMFPKAAAEYVYTKHAFRKNSISFIVQWVMIITVVISASTVALGFGKYFYALFGVDPILSGSVLIVLVSIVSYIGIRQSARFNVVSTLIEMSGLIIVSVIGLFFIGQTNVDYFSTAGDIGGLLAGTGLIFFAYLGFEELVNLSEETKNAERVIPKALIIALAISTILYIVVALSSVTVLGADELAKSHAPLADVVEKAVPQGGIIMSVIALFATGNTVLALLIVSSRMLYGLSHNRAFPSIFSRVGRRKTPYVSVLAVMIVSLGILLVGNIKMIASITDIGIFMVYVAVNASVIALRYREPNTQRSFRSPLSIGKFPVLALLGIISAGLMFFHFDPILIVYEIVIILIGAGLYLVFNKVKKIHEEHAALFRKSLFTSKDVSGVVMGYLRNVSEVMVKNPVTVKPTDSVKEAVQKMTKKSIGSVIVLDREKVAGIITEGDIVRRVVGKGCSPKSPCKDVMTKRPITISHEKDVFEAMDMMSKKNIKKLIVTRNGKLAGIITATDIIRSDHKIDHEQLKKLSKLVPVHGSN